MRRRLIPEDVGFSYGGKHYGSRRYILFDTLTTTLAAGAVHGTVSEPPPGVVESGTTAQRTRTVVDTESKLSIAGGVLVGGAKAAPAFGNPGLWYGAQTRTLGRILIGTLTHANADDLFIFGWDGKQTAGLPTQTSLYFNYSNSINVWDTTMNASIGTYQYSTAYSVAIIQRVTGAAIFIKGGTFTDWTLLWMSAINGAGTTYPNVNGHSDVFNVDNPRIPARLWFPAPVVSDGFGGARTGLGSSDGLGHAEGVAGGIGLGGATIPWTNRVGTSGVGSGVASSSALVGGIAIETVDTGSADGLVESNLVRGTSGIGMVMRYVDSDNYLYCTIVAGNVQLVKRVAGVETNVIAPTAVTYSAGARLRVMLDGTSANVYYNLGKVGATGTVPASTATLHGLYNLSTDSTMDDFVFYLRTGYNSPLDLF